MQEDIKIIVTADTTQAEKKIDGLNDTKIEVEAEIKVPKNPLKEAKEEANLLGKRVNEIKLNKKAFSPEDIKILKSEIEAIALKAKAIHFAEGSKQAKELADRLKEMHKALGEGKKQSKETNKIFGLMDIAVGNLVASGINRAISGMKQMVTEGSKFNRQMEYANEKIRTISGASGLEIDYNINSMGKKTGTNLGELREGLYQTVSAIGDTYKKYTLLETANKLAVTGFSSTNEAVDGLTTVLNAYNIAIEEASRVANVFVRTQKVGKLTVQEFQQQLYKTVPTAKELGIQIEEIGASIALLTAKGSKAEVAQTQMGAFLYELLDTGSDVSKLFNQIAGQSINSFMQGGGSLEGILKMLKGYSNANNFNIESLFGRKEAKSFWLNLGNDIDGYIEKLRAINDPVNELDRNFENLLNTQEKRLARAGNYWQILKQNIGAVAGEMMATVGDAVAGIDKEIAYRQKLNNELDNNLRTLDELSKKQSLNEEEQKKLNEALRVLEILAPEVAEAYKKWSLEGGNYAEVLSLIKKRQEEVNRVASEISYSTAKKDVEETENSIRDKNNILLRRNSEIKYKLRKNGENLEGEKGIIWDQLDSKQKAKLKEIDSQLYSELSEAALQRSRLQEELQDKIKIKKGKEIELDKANGIIKEPSKPRTVLDREKEVRDNLARIKSSYYKKSKDYQLTNPIQNDEEYKNAIKELKNIEQEKRKEAERIEGRIKQLQGVGSKNPEIQKKIDNEIVDLNKELSKYQNAASSGNNTNYEAIKKQIKDTATKELSVLMDNYSKELDKIKNLPLEDKIKAKEKLDIEYERNKGKIEDKKKVETKKNEVERLGASIVNSPKNERDRVEEEIKLLENEIKDITSNRNKTDFETDIKQQEEAEKQRKKAEEEAKKEVDKRYKEEQLKVDTDYNNKMLKATEEYNKAMADLKGQGTKEEIEAVKKAYEEAKREAETEKKIGTLKNKKDNTYYSTDKEKKANTEAIVAEISLTEANAEKEKADKDAKDAQDKNTEAINKMSTNLRNLAGLFQAIGDNTNSTAVKNLANIANVGSTIFDTISKSGDVGTKFLGSIFGTDGVAEMAGFKNFGMGAGIGSAVSGALGGGAEGNIGSLLGAGAGMVLGPAGSAVGSVVGGVLGGAVGSVFGRSKKKKAKREARKRKAAQERLQKGLISGQFKWQDVVEEYNEDLARMGMGSYLGIYDKVAANTNYDNILSDLEASKGNYGVSMETLKNLMPQYDEQQIMDWFKSVAGGAVLNNGYLTTGEGKYGQVDISALAQQITTANRELEKTLKETIKGIIDFSADSLASVVKNGFFDGLDDLGDNIEKMLANSLKNAFINTEISKNLFNGLSDKVADYVKEMFKADGNLGIDLDTGNLENLTFTQYIDLIKKYMEMSNEKLEDLFKELGMNMDNLTNSMDTLNKNMSKNVVTGIATNLWKQNLGLKEPVRIENNQTIEIPVMLNGKEMDRYIIKTVNNSTQRSRRSGNGIGRG